MRARCVQKGEKYIIKYSCLARVLYRLADAKETTEQTKKRPAVLINYPMQLSRIFDD